jgi:hypothetical protein
MIRNMQDVAVLQALLTAITDPRFTLRTLACLAAAAHVSEEVIEGWTEALGLVLKHRRADGTALYGIESRVNGETPVAPVAPVALVNPKVALLVAALEDQRWTMRTYSALETASGMTREQIYLQLGVINARQISGFVGLNSRN